MAYVTYDKAKWHWGAETAPTDIPQENGATHIAFFFRWCMERKLYSKEFAADFADDIARMGDSFDYRWYFFGAMDGVLSSEELNTAGKAFANAYYTTNRTKFAKTHGWYLQDYDDFVARKSGEKNFDNAYFYIENSPQNYAEIKAIIDRRYEEFLETKKASKSADK